MGFAEIATNRFGQGAKPGELLNAQISPKKWLAEQLQPLIFSPAMEESKHGFQLLLAHQKAKKQERAQRQAGDSMAQGESSNTSMVPLLQSKKQAYQTINKFSSKLILNTLTRAIDTDNSFQARLLDFFSNHFSVSNMNLYLRALAPTMEREAIGPNLIGNFSDLLIAVESHPAMLLYLNNDRSIGADSKLGKKRKKRGLNENLAREILELHTLGVNGGYQQQDVRELALAITGWSVGNVAKDEPSGFLFKAAEHQPGERTILSKTYPNTGVEQGENILKSLAIHRSTAEHICSKLARHFIADQPDPILVEDMIKSWLGSAGHLKTVLSTMIEHPLSWLPEQQKFKTPRDFIISTFRACGPKKKLYNRLPGSLMALGQTPFGAGSPAGYGDLSSDWDGAEALMLRIEWAEQLSARIAKTPLEIAQNVLGSYLSDNTSMLLKNAESRQVGLAMMLLSPEFLRR